MTSAAPRRPRFGAPSHPVVLNRRIRDLAALAASAVIPAVIAIAVTVAFPGANLVVILAAVAGLVGIVVLMASSRIEVSVAILAIYLGMLDGPVKLSIGTHEVTAAVRNVLILAVCLGIVMRIVVRKQRVRLPPLSGWVIAFTATVLIEMFNPKTEGILKIVGGLRQQLQWVPFFFFGYLLMRSKRRLRMLFLLVGVVALANGVMSAYQTGLTPTQLASWGPGYHDLIFVPSEAGGKGRVYASEGETRVRPPGLGSEAGFGGGVGAIGLPLCLALLATSRRRKWVAIMLALGAMLAILTGLGRLQLIGAGLGVMSFGVFASIAGQRVTRVIAGLLAIGIAAIPVGIVVVSLLRSGTFKRYENLGTSSSTTLHKESAWKKIPQYLEADPFGFGLGSVGAVSGLGGRNTQLLEGHSVTSETQYNFIVNELGAPGLIVWVALSGYMVVFIGVGMRKVRDGDLAIMLAGTFGPFVAIFIEGSSGPTSTSAAAGPYFWFVVGVAAYWFAGPGRSSNLMRPPGARSSDSTAPAVALPAVVG
jgi:hypothetical protein